MQGPRIVASSVSKTSSHSCGAWPIKVNVGYNGVMKGHANYKSTLKNSGQYKGEIGKPAKAMKMGTMPQRKTHKNMGGMEILNKLSAKQAPKKLW